MSCLFDWPSGNTWRDNYLKFLLFLKIVVDGYFRSPVGKQTSRMSDKNLYKGEERNRCFLIVGTKDFSERSVLYENIWEADCCFQHVYFQITQYNNCFCLALVYLTVFRLDELGAVHYRKMVLSQNISKMFKVRINICTFSTYQ